MNPKRIVLTGGPGTGKTALCKFLENLGYKYFPEVAREAIANGIEPPISNSEISNDNSFENLIITNRIESFKESVNHSCSFFDRGIPDSLAYTYYLKKTPSRTLLKSILDYRYDKIFILPPWKDIYSLDDIRKETFELSEELYYLSIKAYEASDYQLIELPKSSIFDRANFIIDNL